jgi:ubiquinone/menaquinone biosynthesis C-methylase UbiE
MSAKDFQRWNWDRLWKDTSIDDPGEILSSKYTKKAYRCMGAFLDHRTDRRILETSCGTGRFSCLAAIDLPESVVIGTDISKNAIRIAKRIRSFLGADNVVYHLSDMFSLPYADGCFDVVFNEGGIEHFPLSERPNYEDAIHELIRVTRPGGKVIVAVPNFYCLPHTIYKATLRLLKRKYKYGHEKSFRHDELRTVYRNMNLVNIEMAGYFPAHAFYRLDRIRPLSIIVGKLVDLSSNKTIDDLAGYMIVVKGVKPR